MDYIQIVIWTVVSFVILFSLSKLMGARTISNMSMLDYINGIAIGSIAAQLSIAEGKEIIYNIIALILYGLLTYLSEILSARYKRCRNILVGPPIILIEKKKIYFKNFKKANMEMEEFQSALRVLGYFDLSKVETAILEPTGQISVIPVAEEKPVVAMDLELRPEQEEMLANIILDGDICQDNLKRMGKDEKWLEKEIARYKIKNRSDIFLATLDSNDKISFYTKVEPPEKSIL